MQAPDCKHGITTKIKIGVCAMDKKVRNKTHCRVSSVLHALYFSILFSRLQVACLQASSQNQETQVRQPCSMLARGWEEYRD